MVTKKKEIAVAIFHLRLSHTAMLANQNLLKGTCMTIEKILTIRLLGEIKAGWTKLLKEVSLNAMVSSSLDQRLKDARENQS